MKKVAALFLGSLLISACDGNPLNKGLSGSKIYSPAMTCEKLPEITAADYCLKASEITDPALIGNGTTVTRYQICSPYQLNAIGSNPALMRSNFDLIKDMDMSCISENHTPIGSSTAPFQGSIDGRSHLIHNWKRLAPAEDFVGFFGVIRGGHVRNIDFRNVQVHGNNDVGIVAGKSDAAYILNIRVSGTINGSTRVGGIAGTSDYGAINQTKANVTVRGQQYVGGLAGSSNNGRLISSSTSGEVTSTASDVGGLTAWAPNTVIANSYSTAVVTTTGNNAGGLVGSYYAGMFKNNYFTGSVQGATRVGGLIGYNDGVTAQVENSFVTGNVTGNGGTSANVGRFVGATSNIVNSYTLSTMTCDADSSVAGIQVCADGSTGTHAALTDFYLTSNQPLASWDFQLETANGTNDFWAEKTDGLPVAWYDSPAFSVISFLGLGTYAQPYLIEDVSDLLKIGSNPRLMGSVFKLTNPLDFSGETFIPIGGDESPFHGEFYGDYHEMDNVTLNSSRNAGFFGVAFYPAYIEGVSVINLTLNGGVSVGGLVGESSAFIHSPFVTGWITATSHAGGVVGIQLANGLIQYPLSYTNVTSSATIAGGIVGYQYGGDIRYAIMDAQVIAAGVAGGLVGWAASGAKIYDSQSAGQVYNSGPTTATHFGGAVGLLRDGSSISRCFSKMEVNGANSTGGLIGTGEAGSVTSDSFSTGDVFGFGGSAQVGRLIGRNLGTLTNSFIYASSICDADYIAGGVQACNTTFQGSGPNLDYFYDETNPPMNSWDTVVRWLFDGVTFPIFR